MDLPSVIMLILGVGYVYCYPFNEGDIRLVGGSSDSEGTVLIFHDNLWGAICDYNWDIRDANVVCRQLGYPRALQYIQGSRFGRGRRRVWLVDVYCRGGETSLSECYHPGWGRLFRRHHSECRGHKHSAGVVCLNIETTTPSTVATTTTDYNFLDIAEIQNNDVGEFSIPLDPSDVLLGDEANNIPLRHRSEFLEPDLEHIPSTTRKTTTTPTTTFTTPTKTTPTTTTTTPTTTTTTPTTTTTTPTTTTTTPTTTTTTPTTPTTTTKKPTTKPTTQRSPTTVFDIAANLPELKLNQWVMDKDIERWVLVLRNDKYLVAVPGGSPKTMIKEEYINLRRHIIKPPTTTSSSYVFISNAVSDETNEEKASERMKADDPLVQSTGVDLVETNESVDSSADIRIKQDNDKKDDVDKDVSDMLKEKIEEDDLANNSFKVERVQIRLSGGRSNMDGRIEVLPPDQSDWGVICGDTWSIREGIVACRHFGLGYAQQAAKTSYYGGKYQKKYYSAVKCKGTEKTLDECQWEDHNGLIQCLRSEAVAAIICSKSLPDLEPSTYMVETTSFLQDRHMYYLQCAMEENCLAPSAYELQKTSRNWRTSTRRLLRFSSVVKNKGTADFRPESRRSDWEWHACHMHYHSMEVFAHYDITDTNGNRVAEGLKASFCLEDSACDRGVFPKYECQNYGEQGISVGCSDNYMADIDCQWIDITDLKPGNYHFKLEVNPSLKVPEISYDNNGMSCKLQYTGYYARITECKLKSIL